MSKGLWDNNTEPISPAAARTRSTESHSHQQIEDAVERVPTDHFSQF